MHHVWEHLVAVVQDGGQHYSPTLASSTAAWQRMHSKHVLKAGQVSAACKVASRHQLISLGLLCMFMRSKGHPIVASTKAPQNKPTSERVHTPYLIPPTHPPYSPLVMP